MPPFPTGYPAGITGLDALGLARPTISDFRQLSNAVAVAGRLDYAPPSIPGFAGSTSAYFTPNTTPRGAYADDGTLLGRSSLTMVDSEFRYRIPNTGLELRGEGVFVTFGNPANLRANNDSDPTDNVGKTMYGASGEIAYHFPLGTILHSEWEAVPFYRYTYENLQTKRLRRNRSEHAYRSRTVAIPQRRHRHIPFAETRAQGHLSESDQSRPGRGTIGFRSRRRRLLLLSA